MRYLAGLLIITGLLCSCGDKKKPSLSGDEPVVISDFVESFDLIKPPYSIADTTLLKKESDSLLISTKIFSQFVPDSILVKIFGRNAKPKIYLGKRVEIEKQEKYLFAKAITNDKKVSLVLCFDKGNNFKSYLPLLVVDNKPNTNQLSGIDRQYSFYKTTSLKKPDGSLAEGKEVYVYNDDAAQFILIMTDALDDRVREVINPIDTLKKTHKFSGDYVKDKLNIVSIRDGDKAGKINFFIHFDQQNGECTGELKGSANITSSNAAVYSQPGEGCSLQLNFSSTSVSIKEVNPCGSHRGVKCSFDGSYPKKKEPKKKPARKSK